MPLSSQDYVGRYRLLNLIRTGKTCQVWEVMNDLSGDRLAMKLLLAEYRHDRQEVGYMKHEYEVGRALDHRRVIKMYEFGIDRESVYLGMEMFHAPNLKQVIQSDFASLAPHMHECVQQAAEGLAYFHNQGWVHRDIKPDNFLMKPNGEVKLIDFALAVKRARGLMRMFAGNKRIQGTRSYMSPEQIRGKALDERADLYSFGCMLFELLTGKVPFTGSSTAELLNKHLRNPPPSVQASNRNVSDGMAALVKRMLLKAPEARPSNMGEFLAEFSSTEIWKVPPGSPQWQ